MVAAPSRLGVAILATVSTFNLALVASTGRFVSSIAKAERQWNSFSRSVQRQAKILPKSIQEAVPASLALGRHVVKWTAVATAAITGLGGAGVKLAADFEQSAIAFETLLGSSERATRFLRELEVQARRTPFGFAGLQQAARQLLAFGFTSERVLSMITPLGDAVAAMGGSQQMLDSLIRALGQMAAKGKVSAEEMLQLTEQGIPAWQMLAETIGVTVPEAMELASRGVITSTQAIDAILAGMTRRFGGSMEAQADTFWGRWEQIKDSLATITRGFGEDVIRITGLAGAMALLTDAVGRFADAVSLQGFLGALEQAFPPWVQGVIVGIAGAIVGGLVPAIISWLVPALKKLSVSLLATLKPLVPWMAIGAAVATVAYLLARNWERLGAIAQMVWTSMGAVAMYGASLVVRGSGLMLTAMSWLIPGLGASAQAVLGLADSLASAARQALQSAQGTAQVARQAEQVSSTASQAAQAQDGLAGALEAAQKAAEGGVQSFDEVHQVQEGLADIALPSLAIPDLAVPEVGTPAGAIGEGLAAMGDAVSNIADQAASAWEKLAGAMEPVNKAVQWIKDNWPTIGPVVENIASVLSVVLVSALVTVGAKWAWLGAEALLHAGRVATAWTVALGPVGWVTATVTAVAVAVITHWQEIRVATEQVWGAITSWLAGAWASISSVASVVWSAITGSIASAWGAIRAGAETAWQAIAGVISGAWASIRAGAETVWTALTGWLVSSWDGMAAAATSAWAALTGVISTAWEGISSATAAVWDAITGALGAAWDGLVALASGAWASLTTALDAAWSAIETATKSVWNGLTKWLDSTWDGITTTASVAWDAVTNATASAWESVRSVVSDKFQAASDLVAGVATTIRQTVENLKAAVVQTVQQMADGVVNWLTSLKDRGVAAIQGFWEGATGWFRDMYDKVVGHSYIPDMVNESIGWLNKLDAEGAAAVIHMADGVTGAFGSLQVYMQASMQSTFDQILSGTMSFSEGMTAIIGSMGDSIRRLMADRLAKAASESLATMGNWALGVVKSAAKAVAALIQQAYATLLAFFAWSGPAAPGLAGGVIVAGTAAMIALAAKAADAIGLAEGGIITGPTLALMGERRKKEMVLPLERDNVIAQSVGDAVLEAMLTAQRFQQAAGGGPATDDREIVLRIDGTAFARLILPHLVSEGQRQGMDVVLRPATGV